MPQPILWLNRNSAPDLHYPPNNPDSDGDGLTDAEEVALVTDPDSADSDGDGVADGDEVALGTDPNSSDATAGTGEEGCDCTTVGARSSPLLWPGLFGLLIGRRRYRRRR